MKKGMIILGSLLAASSVFCATGCSKKNNNNTNDVQTTNYTVKFFLEFNELYNYTVNEGEQVSEPEPISKAGYKFDGWYTLDGLKFDFSKPISSNISLLAKYVLNDSPSSDVKDEPSIDNPGKDDSDISSDDKNLFEYINSSILELENFASNYKNTYNSLSDSIDSILNENINSINSAKNHQSVNDYVLNAKNSILTIVNEYLMDNSNINVLDASGYLETAYIEWENVLGATSYNVYYKSSSTTNYVKIDNQLIREYPDNYRADILGLPQGLYTIMVKAVIGNEESSNYVTREVNVSSQDRSGFAFSSDSQLKGEAVGAYNLDGTLKQNAIVLYVSEENKNTVSCNLVVDKKGNKQNVIGIGNITEAYSKGYESRPIDIRLIGMITQSGLTNKNDSLNLGFKTAYQNVKLDKSTGITIEGVGTDATLFGVGIRIIQSSNVEIKNIGLIDWPDDGLAVGTSENIWLHNCDIFYGHPGSANDQVKGDGSCDLKDNSKYVTISYMHFWDSGKMSLCGMKSESGENFITYHHNWFDHSDSRHPRVRTMSVHVYNNYYDGNSKYGVGAAKDSNIFVENNYFRNCKNPMLSSGQGSDTIGKGTFSGENGGMIKAFNNYVEGAQSLVYANQGIGVEGATLNMNATSFDAYLALTRDEVVPDTFKTIKGGMSYNNFDTRVDLGVEVNNIDNPLDVKDKVTKYAGRINGGDIKWTFNSKDDGSYDINSELQKLVLNYKSKLISIQK